MTATGQNAPRFAVERDGARGTIRSTAMRPTRPLLVFFVLGAAALALLGAQRGAAADSADKCIKSWPEVRYGALGYNHLVHVANSCATPAECTVTTDVNPEPQKVVVAGKTESVVTTFMGSPARVFKPHVSCVFQD